MNEKLVFNIVEVQLKNFIESIRPNDEEVRNSLDYGYSWNGQYAILFEIVPQWDDSSKVLHIDLSPKIGSLKSRFFSF